MDSSANYLSYPQRPSYQVLVAVRAADEYELRNRPANRFDWMLVYATRVIQQRDMWREIRVGQPPQPSSRHRGAEHLPKRLQPAQSFLSDQDERAIARPRLKACRAIERDLERLGSHLHGRLPRGAKMALRQTAESEQRNVQPIARNELAVEMMRALEYASQLVNSLCRACIWNGREEQSGTTTACKFVHDRLEQIMNITL
jgi:hypothetical protein